MFNYVCVHLYDFFSFSQFPSNTDVDECDAHSDSCDTTNGVCTNIPGTFNCSCTAGYELAVDGRSCNGKILIFGLFVKI